MLLPDQNRKRQAPHWSLQRIRHDLKAMLDASGGCTLAALGDQNKIERIFPELEAEMHRAEALTPAVENRARIINRDPYGGEISSEP